MLDSRLKTEIPALSARPGPPREWACEKHRFGRISDRFSSCRGPQPALNSSYRSDSVTWDGPVALRVHAAEAKTRFGRAMVKSLLIQDTFSKW